MRTPLAALLAAAIAIPALAQEIVSPDEFRDYAEGYTLYFERDGMPFGTESFKAGGQTRWRYTDGTCVRGVWRAHGAQLCFLYDAQDGAGPLCWRMMRDSDGMLARLLDGENAGMEIRVSRRDKTPLLCGDPGRST